MKTKISVISLIIAGVTTASSYNVVVSKEHNKFDNENFIETGITVCDTNTPLLTEVYKGRTFTQSHSECKKELKNEVGAIKWIDTDDYTSEEVGELLLASCNDILINNHSIGTGDYEADIDGTLVTLTCDMDTDGGGWTYLAEQQYERADSVPVLMLDDKNLSYSEVLYSGPNSLSDYGGSFNDGIWDWQGMDFGKNIIKFDGVWSNMTGEFPHSTCNTIPESNKLPSSSYRVIEHDITTCIHSTTNNVSSCAKKVAIKVPSGKRVEGFGDIESLITTGCNGDNYFKTDYKILVR